MRSPRSRCATTPICSRMAESCCQAQAPSSSRTSMCARPISVDDDAAGSAGFGWTPVCNLDRLRAETIVRVHVAGLDLLVIWNDGDVVACDRACPHEQADLGLGQVRAGRLYCPHHAASFDLRDGVITSG